MRNGGVSTAVSFEQFSFQREPASYELFKELEPLLIQHKEEISHYPDIELNPDWSFYLKTEELGLLRLFTMRDQDDLRLIGYNVFFIKQNPHYRKSTQAFNDVLYLDPLYRKSYRGIKFIAWCDEELKKESIEVVYHHVKAKHNFGKALEHLGYELIDLIYGRRLN